MVNGEKREDVDRHTLRLSFFLFPLYMMTEASHDTKPVFFQGSLVHGEEIYLAGGPQRHVFKP